MATYDAIIVGTRCAGASLAMLLARKGCRVLALDRARFPSDTLSTHFLPPRSTHFLHAWGLLDQLAATGCPRIDGVTMHYGPVVLRGQPDGVGGTSAMYCPRRLILDQFLVESARRAGVELRERTVVRDLLWEGERVVGVRATDADGGTVEERADLIIGADGVFSHIARLVGSESETDLPSLTCGYYAYWRGVPTDGVEFYVRDGRDVLVFPTHDDLTCIWAGRSRDAWSDYRADPERAYLATLDHALLARVEAGERATPFRGTNKLPNFYRRAAGKGWALVGDAAYHRDPLTGMGIGDAFLGATLLAEAIERGSVESYPRALREKTLPVFEYTVRAAALKDPTPQVPLYEEIAASPVATRQFMNVLTGSLPYRVFFNRSHIAQLVGGDRAPKSGAAAAPLG
jgi:flavin-dependent dehydrogenase